MILHHVIYMQLLFNSVLALTNNVCPIFADDPVLCTAITGTIQRCGHTCSQMMSLCTLAVATLAIAWVQGLYVKTWHQGCRPWPKGVCQHYANNCSYCIGIAVSAIYHIIIGIVVPLNFPSVHAICSSMNKLSNGALVWWRDAQRFQWVQAVIDRQ